MFKTVLFGTIVAALSASAAFAHITLATPKAPAGGTYKAILQIPHGCDGAATTAIRVQIPEGFIAVKPQPKAGWTLAITTGPYAKSYTRYGAKVTEGTKEVTWSGGNLADAFYDEFMMRGTLAADLPAGSVLYFPTIQECGATNEAWIEIPLEGQPEPQLPAPGLLITDPAH